MDTEVIESAIVGKIVIGWNSLGDLRGWVDELSPFKVGVLTNDVVAKFWLDAVLQSLDGDISLFLVRDGEDAKSIETAIEIWSKMIKNGFTRKSLLIGLGGGVITDLAGFVASTYMRGILLILIPTTLMAQVDAAIGGKTGVNFISKNIIGTFYPPNVVLIDPQTLQTLPREEYLNGLAEVAKYGIIMDRNFFEYLEENARAVLAQDKDIVTNIVKRCVMLKVQVVEEDLRESDKRRILNLGHTIGHGIESASNYRIKHGFAVSVGIVVCCLIAEKLLGFRETDRVIGLLETLGLPTRHNLDPKRIMEAIKVDKKAWYGRQVMILPERIGSVRIMEVPEDLILEALTEVAN